jgi:hypothetical protein
MQRTTINHSAPRLLRYGVRGQMQPSIKRGTMVPRKFFKILLDVVTLLLEQLPSDAFLRKLCRRIWFEALLPYSHQHFIVLSERILPSLFPASLSNMMTSHMAPLERMSIFDIAYDFGTR